MNYTLEIQKLSIKINAVKSLHDKIILLKDAIKIADAHNDVEWGFDLRDELLSAEAYTAKCVESLPAFTWILDAFERNLDLFNEKDFLWKYKWMISYTRRNANISMEQSNAIMEDYKVRLQRNGYGLRAYYAAKLGWAFFLNNIDDAQKYYTLFENEIKDEMSSCQACGIDHKVELELRLGNFEKAVTLAADLFSKKYSCNIIPFIPYCNCITTLIEQGDIEGAKKYFDGAEKELNEMDSDESHVGNISVLLYYLSLADTEKAWRYFEQYVSWSHESEDYHMFRFAKNVLCLLKEPAVRVLKVSPLLPWYRSDNTYNTADLYKYYYNLVQELTNRFNQRNRNTYFTEQVEKVMKIIGK